MLFDNIRAAAPLEFSRSRTPLKSTSAKALAGLRYAKHTLKEKNEEEP
jgi:hypothetical protein